jgi:plastocyanin
MGEAVGRRAWPRIAALAVVAGVAVIPAAPAAPAAPATGGTTVQMVDNEVDLTNWHFDPKNLTVPAGATVVWHNRGHEEHSATADDNSFDSGLTKPGGDFSRAFPKVGVYAYHCAPHPWMTGKIQVVAAAAAAAPTTAPASTSTRAAAPSTTVTRGAAAAGGPPASVPGASSTSAPGATATSAPGKGGTEAAPAADRSRSGGHVAGTIALVLAPTLAGLALGARLRRSRS